MNENPISPLLVVVSATLTALTVWYFVQGKADLRFWDFGAIFFVFCAYAMMLDLTLGQANKVRGESASDRWFATKPGEIFAVFFFGGGVICLCLLVLILL